MVTRIAAESLILSEPSNGKTCTLKVSFFYCEYLTSELLVFGM